MSMTEPIPIAKKKPNGRGETAKKGASSETELRIAREIGRKFGADMRYCKALRGWHVWDGTRFRFDETGAAERFVKAYATEAFEEYVQTNGEQALREAKLCGSARGVRNILELLRTEERIAFRADDANSEPWLLNCANGTVDLRTGELREHRREDLLTRCTDVDFDPDAPSPMFDAFLAKIQPDPEVRGFLQQFFGYGCNGVVRERVLAVAYGDGGNGKSVLASTVTAALGDYSLTAPPTLVSTSRGETHAADVASLVGRRLAIMHETDRGAKFNASKVKRLTGGDEISARFMKQDWFEFTPTHTLFLLSNYKPECDGGDGALWDRIRLVPFYVTIPEDEQDKELPEKLREELPGVLAWIVRGHAGWLEAGALKAPAAVAQETAEYRASEDVVGRFIEEACVRHPQARARAGELFKAFKDWCKEEGEEPNINRGNEFWLQLRKRGIRRSDGKPRIYHGIDLRPSGGRDDEL